MGLCDEAVPVKVTPDGNTCLAKCSKAIMGKLQYAQTSGATRKFYMYKLTMESRAMIKLYRFVTIL